MEGDVAVLAGSILIHLIKRWPLLFPHSFTRYPFDIPCGFLPPFEEDNGLTMFLLCNNDRLGSLSSPVAFHPCQGTV